MSGDAVDNLRMWYNDPMMLGKHFLVFSPEDPRVKRHYTICSSMNPQVKGELLNLAESIINDKENVFDYKMMLGRDSNSVDLTLKTYLQPKGLATRIHRTANKASVLFTEEDE